MQLLVLGGHCQSDKLPGGKNNISSPKNSWEPKCAKLDGSMKNINAKTELSSPDESMKPTTIVLVGEPVPKYEELNYDCS